MQKFQTSWIYVFSIEYFSFFFFSCIFQKQSLREYILDLCLDSFFFFKASFLWDLVKVFQRACHSVCCSSDWKVQIYSDCISSPIPKSIVRNMLGDCWKWVIGKSVFQRNKGSTESNYKALNDCLGAQSAPGWRTEESETWVEHKGEMLKSVHNSS